MIPKENPFKEEIMALKYGENEMKSSFLSKRRAGFLYDIATNCFVKDDVIELGKQQPYFPFTQPNKNMDIFPLFDFKSSTIKLGKKQPYLHFVNPDGSVRECFIVSLDNIFINCDKNYPEGYFSLKITVGDNDAEKVHTCRCDLRQLMSAGCKCGGK